MQRWFVLAASCNMQSKTLKALRQLAKTFGISGYSRMAKPELVREIENRTASVVDTATTTPPAPTPAASNDIPSWDETPRLHGPQDPTLATQEEHVESAKYLRAAPPENVPPSDLGEDIHHLPALPLSMLCLLPQKPGILHAYWIASAHGDYRDLTLRLCRIQSEGFDVHEEVALPAERGAHYFHVPESFDSEAALLQLGTYHDNKFVVYLSRGITRVPTRYASAHIDQAWSVGEDDFRRQYQRAGGVVSVTRRYVWGGAASSSIAASTSLPAAERPLWPGSSSSSST